MTLTSAQYDVLKQKLDAMKRRIQEELKHRDPAQFAHIEIGDASIDDTLQHEAMSQYLHQHAEWEAVQRASARMADNIADVCKECGGFSVESKFNHVVKICKDCADEKNN